MLPAQLWKTRDRRSDSYLSECPLTCLHSFKIQIFCFIKWKNVSFDENNLCFSEILAGFWRIDSNESRHEHETWDMDMRHEHEIWDMDMRHGHGTWDMDMRHGHGTWDMDMRHEHQVKSSSHFTCTSFSHFHYMQSCLAPLSWTWGMDMRHEHQVKSSSHFTCTTICQLLCLVPWIDKRGLVD